MTVAELELDRAIRLVAKKADELWKRDTNRLITFDGYLDSVLNVVCGVTAAPYKVVRREEEVTDGKGIGKVPEVSRRGTGRRHE